MSNLMEEVAGLMQEVAAKEIMPRFRKLAEGEIMTKQGGDLVTAADLAAEAVLAPALEKLVPGSLVVGEEAAAKDPDVMKRLAEPGFIWTIDPVDGTSNFAEGRAVFAVMIALVRDGETVAGWIHDPISGQTASAAKGEGAFMAGRRLKVKAAPENPAEMRGTLHASSYATGEVRVLVEQRRNRVLAEKSLRCAGHEYLRLVRGELDFSLFTRLMPWDHAPGILIHAEAGGLTRLLDGRDYSARIHQTQPMLTVADEVAWHRLSEALFGAH